MQSSNFDLDQVATQADSMVAGCVITDDLGRAFVHRRSAYRKLFPLCWDIVGGHVEVGETLQQCLAREITEETGWKLREIVREIGRYEWSDSNGKKRIEYDFVVKVDGDLSQPRLEQGKQIEFRWISLDETALLNENRAPDDTFIEDIVRQALMSSQVRDK